MADALGLNKSQPLRLSLVILLMLMLPNLIKNKILSDEKYRA